MSTSDGVSVVNSNIVVNIDADDGKLNEDFAVVTD